MLASTGLRISAITTWIEVERVPKAGVKTTDRNSLALRDVAAIELLFATGMSANLVALAIGARNDCDRAFLVKRERITAAPGRTIRWPRHAVPEGIFELPGRSANRRSCLPLNAARRLSTLKARPSSGQTSQ